MPVPRPAERLSPEAYYARERTADHKSEYYAGEVFAMAGSSTRHALITSNVLGELHGRLKGGGCRAYTSDQRIKVQASGLRSYPDVSVFCGRMEYDLEDPWKETAVNPTMLFEVLSDSTLAYDRGVKSGEYRRIPSLRAYMLIDQAAAHVEHYERGSDGSWVLTEAYGLEASIKLTALGIELPLAELYAGVDLDAERRFNVVKEG